MTTACKNVSNALANIWKYDDINKYVTWIFVASFQNVHDELNAEEIRVRINVGIKEEGMR